MTDDDCSLADRLFAEQERWQRPKTPELDVWTTASLATLRDGVLGNGDENRYIMGHARIVIDRLGGALADLVADAARFPARHRESCRTCSTPTSTCSTAR
jgi:hypothetical protein